MRRILLSLSLLLCAVGCAPTTTTPPLAPGYANQTDQVMGETLAAANGFYHSIQCQTQAKAWDATAKTCAASPQVTSAMTLTPTEKTAFNSFAVALNTANAVYLNFHAGTATQAQAQTAINTVQTQQSAIEAQITQAVK